MIYLTNNIQNTYFCDIYDMIYLTNNIQNTYFCDVYDMIYLTNDIQNSYKIYIILQLISCRNH